MTRELTEKEFQNKTLNQKEVYFSGFGNSWDVKIYYNSDDGHYYLIGPFGRWDAICYYDLGPLTQDQVQDWISNFEKQGGKSGVPTRNNIKP